MILLRLLAILLIFGLVVLLVLQVILPAIDGRKLFPAFRKNELARAVETTRDEVETLREHNANLSELTRLQEQKRALEEVAAPTSAAEPAAETKSE